MEVARCVQDYLADCYALASSTRELYKTHLTRFSRYAGDKGLKEMSDISAREVRQYLRGLRRSDGEEYSRAFLDQVYRTLNTWFHWSVEEGILESNPMDRVRHPRVPKKKSPCLSLEQIKRVLELIEAETLEPERNLAMTWLMLDSGLRLGEVVGLNRGDLDLERGVARVLGKDQEERYVPLGKQSIRALRAYSEIRRRSNGAQFLDVRGRRISGNAVRLMLRRVGLKAKGVDRLYPHLLRHTFANWWIKNGGGLRKLQEILGHSDVRTTASIYVSPELDDLQAEHACVSVGSQFRTAQRKNQRA
jgi:site-specific recombinase XerD